MTSILTNTAAIAALFDTALDQQRYGNNAEPYLLPAIVLKRLRTMPPTGRSQQRCVLTTRRLETVKDALGLGAAMTDTAYTALQSSIKVVDEIRQS